ncbi:probable threonine protease PRSS50 [Ovis aries]|uniref:probable threonine protease PRSS50 n=1 Tax=Ovis aries TaxID=9940 RepID=UPI001C2EAD87|nr:probable threonine protease PRSS50 [Ovis aries]
MDLDGSGLPEKEVQKLAEREERRGAVDVSSRWSFGVSSRPAGAAPRALGRPPWPWPSPPPGSCWCCLGPWVRPAPSPPPTPSDLASTSDSLPPSTGCLSAGDALGALSTDVPADLDAPCAPSATCPSGRHRFPRQVTGGSQPPSVSQYAPSKASDSEFLPPFTAAGDGLLTLISQSTSPFGTPRSGSAVVLDASLQLKEFFRKSFSKVAAPADIPSSTCGFSYERDPTLRDPESMARRWPWMVSVRANGTHICAGTLIASEWVLTAAHCTTESDITYSVRAGSPWIDQITKTTIDTLAKEVIVHSRYRASRYWSWVGRANDIALLNLERPLQYSKYVWPICLPGLDYSVKDYSLCTVTGWGLPRVGGEWPQFRTIQEKEVTILNSTECDSLYHRFSKIPSLIQIINSQMICAKDVDREKFCYEISGEPLACPVQNVWHLVGVVSWGPGCKKSEAPPIYVHISSYQQWIWDRVSGQTLPAPSRALLLALLMLLSFLAAL